MSILDVFTIIFDGDSSGSKKASEETQKHIGEVEKKTKQSEEANVKLGESFVGVTRNLTALAAGFVTFGGLKTGITNAVGFNLELGKTSKFLSINAKELAAWKGAIDATGYSGEQFEATVKKLATQFIQMGRPDLARNTIGMLKDFAEAAKDMPRDVAIARGLQMGLDEGTIAFLLDNVDALDQLIERQMELNNVSPESIENAKQLNAAWENLGKSSLDLQTTLMDGLTPALLLIVDGLMTATDWVGNFFGKLSSYGKKAVDRSWGQVGMDLLTGEWMDVAEKDKTPKPYKSNKTGNDTDGIFIDEPAPPIEPINEIESLNDLLNKSNEQLSMANSSPFSATTSNAISNNNSRSLNKEINLTTGQITINTQATDAEGVAAAVGGELNKQIRYLVDNNIDGEA